MHNIKKSIAAFYNETYEGFKMEEHFHNFFEIIYIVDGSALFNINGKEYRACDNNIIFINNFESHNVKLIKYPYKRYYILIDSDYLYSSIKDMRLVSILKCRPQNFRHVLCISGQNSAEIYGMIKKLYEEINNEYDLKDIALKSYFSLLFTFIYREFKPYFMPDSYGSLSNEILKIQKYIEDHYNEDITLSKAAGLFYMDRYYLSHIFKEVTGYTFREYVIRQRLSKAKDMLYYTDETITDICTDSGFNNVNNFIRTFKNYEGITAHRYRKKYRKLY